MRGAIDVTAERIRRAPRRFVFFAEGESVYFGDVFKARREALAWKRWLENGEQPPDGPEGLPEDFYSWPITGGDCENAETARFLARLLNAGLTDWRSRSARRELRGGRR